MTYVTHKRIAAEGVGLITAMFLYEIWFKGYGGKIFGIDVGYYIMSIVVYVFSSIGGVYPDIDQGWKAVPDKTITKRILNKVVKLFGGKHRSWMTHSIDIGLAQLGLAVWLPGLLEEAGILTGFMPGMFRLMYVGFAMGWLAHLLADMMTMAGVRMFCFLNFKVRLVPKRFMGIDFKTEGKWEGFVRYVAGKINIMIYIVWLLYPMKDIIMVKM